VRKGGNALGTDEEYGQEGRGEVGEKGADTILVARTCSGGRKPAL